MGNRHPMTVDAGWQPSHARASGDADGQMRQLVVFWQPSHARASGDRDCRNPTVVPLTTHRRHLTESQRAMVAARLQAWYRPEAEERRTRKPADSVPVNLPEQNAGESRDRAAAALNVSGKSVSDAAAKSLTNHRPIRHDPGVKATAAASCTVGLLSLSKSSQT